MVANLDLLTSSNQEQISPEFQELERPEGELHLRFYVSSSQEFALPATAIREVISSPSDRITPIPNTSPLFLGTLNLRGRVIWVADFGHFLGEPTAVNTERPEIPIIAIEEQDTIVGLAVNQIVGMEWLNVEQVQMLINAPGSMAAFIRGHWVLDEHTKQCLRLLDQRAIVRSARWIG